MRVRFEVNVGVALRVGPAGERPKVVSPGQLNRPRTLKTHTVPGVHVAEVLPPLIRRAGRDLLHVLQPDRLVTELRREHRRPVDVGDVRRPHGPDIAGEHLLSPRPRTPHRLG